MERGEKRKPAETPGKNGISVPPRLRGGEKYARRSSAQRKAYGKRRRARIYLVVSLAAIVLSVIVAGTIFFKVENFEIIGNGRYSDEDIAAATGISYGSNLFLMNKFRIIDRMLADMIFLKSVEIRRVLPGTVRVTVEEVAVVGYVRDGGEWLACDGTGRILERGDSLPRGACAILGVEADKPEVGKSLAVAQSEKQQPFEELLGALYESGLYGHATQITLEKIYELGFTYKYKYKVTLGRSGDLLAQCKDVKLLAELLESEGREEAEIEVINGELRVLPPKEKDNSEFGKITR